MTDQPCWFEETRPELIEEFGMVTRGDSLVLYGITVSSRLIYYDRVYTLTTAIGEHLYRIEFKTVDGLKAGIMAALVRYNLGNR